MVPAAELLGAQGVRLFCASQVRAREPDVTRTSSPLCVAEMDEDIDVLLDAIEEEHVKKKDGVKDPYDHDEPPIYTVMCTKTSRSNFSYKGRIHESRDVIQLTKGWMRDNFSNLEAWWKDLHANPGKWTIVPAGGVQKTPSVTFQGDKPYCVSYGLASALRYCGYDDHADKLEKSAEEVLNVPRNQVGKAVAFVTNLGGWLETKRIPNFDPLNDVSPHPTILQLHGSDHDNTHVVGIAGEWIFDSNQRTAMPLCKESLDKCCLGRATFLHSAQAVRFFPTKQLKRTKKKQLVWKKRKRGDDV